MINSLDGYKATESIYVVVLNGMVVWPEDPNINPTIDEATEASKSIEGSSVERCLHFVKI